MVVFKTSVLSNHRENITQRLCDLTQVSVDAADEANEDDTQGADYQTCFLGPV